MDNLPNDILTEIVRRLSVKDALCLGTTSKTNNYVVNDVFNKKEINMRNSDLFVKNVHSCIKIFEMEEFTYTLYRFGYEYGYELGLQHGQRVGTAILTFLTFIDSNDETDIIRNLEFSDTKALLYNPSKWTTHLKTIDQLKIQLTLCVTPAEKLDDWKFVFSINEDDEDDYDVYRRTTAQERFDKCEILVASWYEHARRTLMGRRLRSHKNVKWLPKEMPSISAYSMAAYNSVEKFVWL